MAVLTSQVASAMLKIPPSEPLAVPSLEYFCHLCFHASGFGIFFSHDHAKMHAHNWLQIMLYHAEKQVISLVSACPCHMPVPVSAGASSNQQ